MSDHRSPSSTPVSCDYFPLWVGRLSISGVAMSHGVARVSSCCGTVHHLLWLCCHRVVARLCRYCGWTLLLLWLCGMYMFCVHVYVLSRTPLSTFSRTPYSLFSLLLFLVLRTPLLSLSRTRVCILTYIDDVTMTHTLRHFHVLLFNFDRGQFRTFSLFHFLLFSFDRRVYSCALLCRLWRYSLPHSISALSASSVPIAHLCMRPVTCSLDHRVDRPSLLSLTLWLVLFIVHVSFISSFFHSSLATMDAFISFRIHPSYIWYDMICILWNEQETCHQEWHSTIIGMRPCWTRLYHVRYLILILDTWLSSIWVITVRPYHIQYWMRLDNTWPS